MRALLAFSLAAAVAAYQYPLHMADQTHVEGLWDDAVQAPGNYPMGLVMALNLQNIDKLRAEVDDRSNPRSANYGKWMTREQVRDLTAAPADAIESVVRFCKGPLAGTAEVTPLRDFVNCVAPAANVSAAFGADVRVFSHKHSKRSVVRAHPRRPLRWPAGSEDAAAAVSVIEGLADFFDYPSDRKATKRMALAKAQAAAGNNKLIIFPPRGSEVKPTIEVFSASACDIQSEKWGVFINGRKHQEWNMESSAHTTEGHTYILSGPWTPYMRMSRITIVAECNIGQSTGTYNLPFYTPSPWGTPRLVADHYGLPSLLYKFDPRASQGVASFEKQYYSPDDLVAFRKLHGLPNPPVNLIGPNEPSSPGGEATLDIQWVTAMAPEANTTFWSVGGPGPAHGFAYILTWAMQMLSNPAPPLVTSISYGDTEGGYKRKFGNYSYITRMEQSLMQLAGMGHTVVAGSGDAGATNVGEAGNDISSTDPDCSIMRPFYPSNSHYVVSVSATFLNRYATGACQVAANNGVDVGPCGKVAESPVSLRQGTFWTTGGGFSGVLPRPTWQDDVVPAYVRMASSNSMWPTSSQFDSEGRGYPDISTIGYNLECVDGGAVVPIGGTSASGPVLAGIFTQINNLRLANGQSPIGPPHQVLYAKRQNVRAVTNDVTVGDNRDGDHQFGDDFPATCPNGFPAMVGWDAVTGLGSPQFDLWMDIFLNPSKNLA